MAISLLLSHVQFSADVLGCNVLSTDLTVFVVDTWNLEGSRFNQRDTTDVGCVVRSNLVSLHIHLRVSCSLFPGRPGCTHHFL